MPNLTKEQKTLLLWMSTGQTFKVCSDYCPDKGDIIPARRLPVRVFAKTIEKLYQAGFISFVPVVYFGLRWDEFSLTHKGKEAIWTT
ncbi:hypothetical protein [Vibrio ezurae]|uniref:Transcriptional regulator n=1 Tax=Vibrio ezurae NBRC 102218 TaxID=1219080 RepID=U3CRA5_9VIBR|nr:hypothetical protein [Vibrio ezurae]GAD80628.1 hypothetical protein VEZ01S_38_00170 [Vibrio ezurae NBRC 102218]